jgi:hypothetical protein
MKRYGNIRFTRRVVVALCLFVSALAVLICGQTVRADDTTYTGSTMYSVTIESGYPKKNEYYSNDYSQTINYTSSSPVYSFIAEEPLSDGSGKLLDKRFNLVIGFCSASEIHADELSEISPVVMNGCYFYTDRIIGLDWQKEDNPSTDDDYITKMTGSKSDIFQLVNDVGFYQTISDYLKTGVKADGMIVGGSDTHPTDVTNKSIGYLQNVKLNLSYITPIKGDSIFETTNYQIYSDMIYNLKWNSKKTSTNYDLSSSYVQLYAKAEYSKSEYDKVSATDFIELGDFEKASKGKLKFSFLELFEKSNNCKSAYLSAFPLSSADYKNGKLQACSVTSNIKYKFYIRVYKGTDKGPWLCVSEKGSHHSNEFVNSGDKVPFNVSSGDLNSDGTYKPDGNINENGNGITGTGTDKDDADADTNANDKIQTKHDSSDNSVWDNLENLVSGIASVPIIIKDIFSFLPSWCLNLTATGFALIITVCVIRFIRGK